MGYVKYLIVQLASNARVDPLWLVLDAKVCNPTEVAPSRGGGNADIFRGEYADQPVALKHPRTLTKSSPVKEHELQVTVFLVKQYGYV